MNIYDYLLTFLCVVLSNIPYYLFFILMYFILKKISPNGNIRERFYTKTISTKENKILSAIEVFLNLIYKNIVHIFTLISIALIILIVIIKIKSDSIIYYLLSNEALRFQKYLIESLLTIILAIVGLITVFGSLNKQYYLFFSSKDVIELLKTKNTLITTVIFYALCVISVFTYYIGFYIIKNEEAKYFIETFCFIFSIVSSIATLIPLLKLFYSIIMFLLSNKTEQHLLNSLYKRIYDKNTLKIQINNPQEIKESLDNLILNLNEQKMSDEDILFVPYITYFENFSANTRRRNIVKTIFWAVIINLFIIFFSQGFGGLIKINLILFFFLLAFSIVFNCIVCNLLYKTPLHEIFIHSNLNSWGLLVHKNGKEYYPSIYKNDIYNRKYNKYFKNLYCILQLFKEILNTNQSTSLYCLNRIIEKIYSGQGDYLLYTLCLFMYDKKYNCTKIQKFELHNYIENNDAIQNKWDLIKNNTGAIIEDIERYDCKNEVNDFLEKIKTANNKMGIKKKINVIIKCCLH